MYSRFMKREEPHCWRRWVERLILKKSKSGVCFSTETDAPFTSLAKINKYVDKSNPVSKPCRLCNVL